MFEPRAYGNGSYCCTLTHLEDLDELIAAVFEEQRKAGLDPDDVREVPFP